MDNNTERAMRVEQIMFELTQVEQITFKLTQASLSDLGKQYADRLGIRDFGPGDLTRIRLAIQQDNDANVSDGERNATPEPVDNATPEPVDNAIPELVGDFSDPGNPIPVECFAEDDVAKWSARCMSCTYRHIGSMVFRYPCGSTHCVRVYTD